MEADRIRLTDEEQAANDRLLALYGSNNYVKEQEKKETPEALSWVRLNHVGTPDIDDSPLWLWYLPTILSILFAVLGYILCLR